MQQINELLLWEKWRPKNLNDIVLLPRISKHFKDGLKQNYIFYGSYGTGKTSLARILIGKYANTNPHLEINSSLYTSIDVLRNDIENFCKTKSLIDYNNDFKYILLDEFERVSPQFQDAFKAFIEKYSNFGVRFILTTNHINKISGGIKSRLYKINFDCQNQEEERYLKINFFKRINNIILPSENKTIPKDILINIINKKFPDFRSILVEIQTYFNTGNDLLKNEFNDTNKIKHELYNLIYNPNISYEEIYQYLINTFGSEKINDLLNLLGRPFVEWSIKENKNVEKLFKCNYIITDYSSILEDVSDPLILGMTVIGKFRDILLK